MTALPVLKGKHVVLRPLCVTDKVDRFACGRNAEYVRMMGGDSRNMPPLTPEEVDWWFDRMMANGGILEPRGFANSPLPLSGQSCLSPLPPVSEEVAKWRWRLETLDFQ